MSRKILLAVVSFAFVFAFVAGCGGDDAAGTKPGEPPTPKQAEKEKMKGGGGLKSK